MLDPTMNPTDMTPALWTLVETLSRILPDGVEACDRGLY